MAKWFERSEKEREVAILLMERGYFPEACFHSHMAVELKLKGYILQRTGSVMYTHSLKRLLQEIAKLNEVKVSEELLDCANFLSMLYTGSRYPEESLVDLDRQEGERCVKCMERLLNSV
ncbi:HEPN domain protein [Metallosphaera sedula]|uniref:HEPN domain protein n=3 Tax=Metallosphaera TaxID=41980 RepID=A4YGF4_METS5|nr:MULTISPECIES: HEPN domain-containing protein [Metallosphaera]ABP95506.1 HEPN domain protein [Metallosphaera sedula DSM 5348]AIM27490.1 HEPN domain protein [Metallosphaera sedula]AKV74360.1 DNA-binding protein [Metallosphaera sedula]AKV76599.1 DNA-binding protein [Metallosphaera sedula]AKV78851.1 DNA-binding protein [Metallosphaera sedula]